MSRFEGSGPVGRHWLARCEGFAVAGGARGVVAAVVHDGDPHFASALVVRRRGRERVVSVGAVEAVDPEARTLVIARPERRRRQVPGTRTASSRLRDRGKSLGAGALCLTSRTRDEAVRVAGTATRSRAAAVLAGSFRRLGSEVLASASWRPYVRFVRFDIPRPTSLRSLHRRTTSFRTQIGRRISRATSTTSST